MSAFDRTLKYHLVSYRIVARRQRADELAAAASRVKKKSAAAARLDRRRALTSPFTSSVFGFVR